MKTADIYVTFLDRMGTDLRVANAARVTLNKWHWKMTEADVGLIHYLAEHDHWSPFAHCFMTFRITAPMFVARQLQKHTVGFAWNEMSRRYVDDEPEFYIPEARKRAEGVKQGSLDEVVDDDGWIERAIEFSDMSYSVLLEKGVAPEVARAVLPMSTMTSWIWSGSLYAFARVCRLRLAHEAQKETRIVAREIYRKMDMFFPVSTDALLRNLNDKA